MCKAMTRLIPLSHLYLCVSVGNQEEPTSKVNVIYVLGQEQIQVCLHGSFATAVTRALQMLPCWSLRSWPSPLLKDLNYKCLLMHSGGI